MNDCFNFVTSKKADAYELVKILDEAIDFYEKTGTLELPQSSSMWITPPPAYVNGEWVPSRFGPTFFLTVACDKIVELCGTHKDYGVYLAIKRYSAQLLRF